MKVKKKFLFVIMLIFMLCSCGDILTLDENQIDTVKVTVDDFQSFEDEVSYITSFGAFKVSNNNGVYFTEIYYGENTSGTYQFKDGNVFFNDKKLEHSTLIKTIDDFARAIVTIIEEDSYIICINDFVPLIRSSYKSATTIHRSQNRGNKYLLSVDVTGDVILNDDIVINNLKKINNISISNSDRITITITITEDFKKLICGFSMTYTNNSNIIIDFQ